MTIPNSPPIQTPVDVREKALTRIAVPWSQWFIAIQNFLGIESTWVPTFTGLTVVNGTGGATYSGTYTKIGRIVYWSVVVTVTGTCTTASAAGSTWINNLPVIVAGPGTLNAVSAALASYGIGVVTLNTTKAYVPTWAATNSNITISGWYST